MMCSAHPGILQMLNDYAPTIPGLIFLAWIAFLVIASIRPARIMLAAFGPEDEPEAAGDPREAALARYEDNLKLRKLA